MSDQENKYPMTNTPDPGPASNDPATKLLVIETICSVCWFVMDASWMFGLSKMAIVLAVLTIASNLLVFRFAERTASYLLVTAAMTFWASMNVCWMLNDLKVWAAGLTVAAVFFVLGTLSLIAAFASARSNRETLNAIIARFRRLRVPTRKN